MVGPRTSGFQRKCRRAGMSHISAYRVGDVLRSRWSLRRRAGPIRGIRRPGGFALTPRSGCYVRVFSISAWEVLPSPARFADAGVPVALCIEGALRELPGGVDLAAYRIVQEALTNTLKHAGAASSAGWGLPISGRHAVNAAGRHEMSALP